MESSPLLLGFVGGFALFAFISMTSFIKLSVVFLIVRQALGMQQIPSNMVIMALSVFISAYIAKPIFELSVANVAAIGFDFSSPEELMVLINAALLPFKEFMQANIDPNQVDFLVDVSNELWAVSGTVAERDELFVLVPSFMLSELTQAFKIGFLLYLPFVAIDLAITGILMALGMQMVQPNIIAVPFKLLTFVFVDGWVNLVEGLILTYAG